MLSGKRIFSAVLAFATASAIMCGCASDANNSNEKQNDKKEENNVVSSANGRITLDFDSNWKFLKLTQKDGLSELKVEETKFDDSDWESISLPHTWNAIDGADGWSGTDEGGEHYYRGLGGYRKTFKFNTATYEGKEIFIEFEGANTVSEVYVNGELAGKHEGGFSAFRFDITDLVKLGEDNVIAVKVNNAPTDYIAPITAQGDFTKMGGIYRDVSIIAVDPVHIDLLDYGAPGVYVTPANITDASADIGVLVRLKNDSAKDADVTVKAEIADADGNIVATTEANASLKSGQNGEVTLDTKVEKPALWNGVENPYLYTAKVTVTNNGETVDGLDQTFGIRTYYIDYDEGFFLNGEYLDLHGVNYHQDSYEDGWAMTNEQRERDYSLMIDMGCNTVRMAHYQHDGYEYDLCDRLGITVWTEIGIVNKMSADDDTLALADGFVENAQAQLRELIRQNYNHPSVIVWGISNELHQMTDEIFDIYTELNNIVHEEDSTRISTYADNQAWGRFQDIPTDVLGYNKYYGWYIDSGDSDFGKWLDGRHKSEKRPISVSEYGAGAAVSQHKDNIVWAEDIDSWGTRHYENYQSAVHEDIWAQFSTRKYLWGKYIWCMFDFASDGRQEGDTKGQNDKGVMTRERVAKDSYYFYKSVWNDEPMVHLTEQRFTTRSYIVPEVKAYSNAEKVELFVNGESMGVIERSSLDPLYSTVFVWKNVIISFEKSNDIKVVAYLADGTTLESKATWNGEYVEPEIPEENIALGKPVVYVSSEENGNPAEKINDGTASDGSRWCAASATSYPASVIIDLEDEYELTKIKVVTHKPGSRAYKYIVSVADTQDGEYTVIVDKSDNTNTNGYFTHVLTEETKGRFLKIEVVGCSDSSAFPCTWELEAYATVEE